MLLAAGRGDRMGPLTVAQPKPMLELCGEKLIERHLRRLAEAGITEIVINLSYKAVMLRDFVGEKTRWGQSVAFSDEGEPPLETGGGIVNALPLLGPAPFIVVNADIYTDFDFARLLQQPRDPLLVLVANPRHNPRGDFGLAASGRVSLEPPLWTFSGISVMSEELFVAVPPERQPLLPILQAAIAKGLLRGTLYEGVWRDVGTPERLAEARSLGPL
jgi:MurNAc alpha-1-phosphate uridylyltransferase